MSTAGCSCISCGPGKIPVQCSAPRELTKTILPPYRIEPPDVLQVDALNVVPKAPYKLRMLDSLVIRVSNALPDAPLNGVFVIEMGGFVNLGFPYGRAKVSGMTVDEAKVVIEDQLKQTLREPIVSVAINDVVGKQQIAGPAPGHARRNDLVGQLRQRGGRRPNLAGSQRQHRTLPRQGSGRARGFRRGVQLQQQELLRHHAGRQLGDGVTKFPITGNDTVLDAIAQISGLTSISSTKIWIARPGHTAGGCDQILPVDWIGLTQRGDATTNYQLLPGDRVYVAEDKLVTLDNYLAKIIAPMERVFGIALLGNSTVHSFKAATTAPAPARDAGHAAEFGSLKLEYGIPIANSIRASVAALCAARRGNVVLLASGCVGHDQLRLKDPSPCHMQCELQSSGAARSGMPRLSSHLLDSVGGRLPALPAATRGVYPMLELRRRRNWFPLRRHK